MNAIDRNLIKENGLRLCSGLRDLSNAITLLIAESISQAAERREASAALLIAILESIRPNLPVLFRLALAQGSPPDPIDLVEQEIALQIGSKGRLALYLSVCYEVGLEPVLVQLDAVGVYSELTPREAIEAGWWVDRIVEALCEFLKSKLLTASVASEELSDLTERLALTSKLLWKGR